METPDETWPAQPRRERSGIEWVRLLLPAVLIFVLAASDRQYLSDFWQHLARGREIVSTGTIVSSDPFTFTVAGASYRDCNWLTQVFYYGTYQIGGLSLVQAINALVLAMAMAVLTWQALRASGSTRLAGAVGVCAVAGLAQSLTVRPQSFSILLFVIAYQILDRAIHNRRWLFILPPLLALWANVHGGFSIGLVLIGAFLLADVLRLGRAMIGTLKVDRWSVIAPRSQWTVLREHTPWALGACLAACTAATLLNPYTIDVYRYAGALSKIGIERGIEEWLPPSLQSWMGIMLILSVQGFAILLYQRFGKASALTITLLLCFLPPALISMRMIPWWFLSMAPMFAKLLAGDRQVESLRSRMGMDDLLAEEPTPRSSPALARFAFILMAVACVGSLPWADRINPLSGTMRSTQRTEDDLAALVPALPLGRVFTRLEWGNFLCWARKADNQIFAEGHIEMYPDRVWEEYMNVSSGAEGWQKVLRDYDVQALMLDASYHRELLGNIAQSRDWKEVARSGPAVVFARQSPAMSDAR